MTTKTARTEPASPAARTLGYEQAMEARRRGWDAETRALAAELADEYEFAARLRLTRQALGLSQVQVAAITGEDQGDISRMERGLLNPGVARAQRNLAALGAYADEQAGHQATAPVTWTPLARARAAADYLLTIQDEEDSITNLKLQKLLYYAQGLALALFRQPLFGDKIKAWAHGPVVSSVWGQYKEHAAAPIPPAWETDFSSLDGRARLVLERAYAEFGQFTGGHLRDMTHNERPWLETWSEEDHNREIPPALLDEFFTERFASTEGATALSLPTRDSKGASEVATNKPVGDGHRNGAVRGRSQTKTPSGNWVKRDTSTGRFMDVKSSPKPFKGVRKEK